MKLVFQGVDRKSGWFVRGSRRFEVVALLCTWVWRSYILD